MRTSYQIVASPSGSGAVWDDELVLAFLAMDPVTEGQVLVIPKQHAVGLDDVPARAAARMMDVAQQLARALKSSSLRCEGVTLFFADGAAGFQEVFHSHLHVFPRCPDDGFTIDARWKGSTPAARRRSAAATRSSLPAVGQ